ncbi:hypothetical protein HYR99_15285 [Candidatus Poribacteria bacterium]|nr:hypothetical protein [Candidatus Poribacteria bacterium]
MNQMDALQKQRQLIRDFFQAEQGRKEKEEEIELRKMEDEQSAQQAFLQSQADAKSKLQREIEAIERKKIYRRRLIFTVSGMAIVALLAISIGLYGEHSKAQLYNSAKASLEGGNWLQAQDQLLALLKRDSNYRDAPTLLRDTQTLLSESYYRLGSAAVKDGKWEEALDQLKQLNPSYRDTTALLCEAYYRLGAEAIKKKNWKEARKALDSLQRLNPSYRDAALLRKTIYRLEDNFIDNRNQWPEKVDDEVMLKIKNYYIIQNKVARREPEAYRVVWKTIDISKNENYRIESTMMKMDGANSGFGLVWGLRDVST